MKTIDDKHIHTGHRGRMYEKLSVSGSEFFHTYELLEMLLYNVVAYKDTSPVAKRLLAAFGSLDGVFSASRDELMQVEGVGAKIADFIIDVGKLSDVLGAGGGEREVYDDYTKIGEYFLNYFGNTEEYSVSVMLLDNSMRLISVTTVSTEDFGKAVCAKDFIEIAVKANASVAIIAHTHPYGPLHPTASDFETNKTVREGLIAVGVVLAEHYVICGKNYVGFMERPKNQVSQHPNLLNFFRTKSVAVGEV